MKLTKKLLALTIVLTLIASMSLILFACNNNDDNQTKSADTTQVVDLTFTKAENSEDGYATVYIPSNRDINILVLSDPQVDTTQKYKYVGSLGNDATYAYIKDLVSAVKPDFVIINGDLVMNDIAFMSSSPYYTRYAEIFEELKTPWAFTSGNHDCDGNYANAKATIEDKNKQATKETIINYMSTFEYCLTSSDENCESGEGNCFINVRKQNGELAYTLCLFDCVYDTENKTYTYTPTAEQVRWYRDTINSISDKELGTDRTTVVKSMIFNHVGIPEFYTAWKEAWNDGNPTSAYYYGHYFDGNYTKKYGDMDESERIFSVVKQLGSTTAIFMCHHHDNDFSVDYQGIRLTFGQHSGYAHNYRTTHDDNGLTMSAWKGVSFELIDDYGDERGGTMVTISGDSQFTISQVFGRDVLSNYATDYYIDYDLLAQSIEANPNYENGEGTVTRGTYRKWKLEQGE